jgi:putative ABC transport system ATP-binding protein
MIALRGIGKEYDGAGPKAEALKGIDLSIGRGEYVAVVGPAGSGKSTLLRILGILDTATAGSYFLENYDITTLPDREHARIRNGHFGFLFKGFNLFSELSALENVMLPMGYAGVRLRRRKERAAILLEEVGLPGRMRDLPSMMTGVEQQRVAIARALANDPDAILADEPTGNLPSDRGEEIMDMLESLNARGVTIVMATQDPDQGARARRRLYLRDGEISGEDGSVRHA